MLLEYAKILQETYWIFYSIILDTNMHFLRGRETTLEEEETSLLKSLHKYFLHLL